MRIFVKLLKGSECEVTVASSATVLDVKQQLQSQVSIPVDQQKLISQGKALADDKPLSFYKITNGSKLFLMLKKPDGTGITPATTSSTPSRTPMKSPDNTSPMSVDTQEELFTIADDPTGFWGKLSEFLKRHFTERDASKVLKEFKRNYDHGINSLSLDDIERLATRQLHPHHANHQDTRT
ncbi:ubiquitin-like protein 4A [Dreissena polymorpha]|uniref:Ubiquitin-like domain-containing protein n=1 Tax=Dreissena polymorpha TaxID=45954 RepID=A0A9D4RVI5_DREPO|nr:ubiquitin-like protein 4A [Dreissena polymorpha]KAH3880112.1 hypothetical protein DPMN_004025 [Dreissena polymorpha]